MKQQLRIAVMGCASIARRSMIPAILAEPAWTLVAVASRDQAKAQDFAVQFGCEAVLGYENLLDRTDVDAVYMPLPTGLHDEWIPRCLDAGKHVLAEKSIANHPDSAEGMVARARARSLVLMEDYMFLYHRQIATVQRMLAQGEIGTLRVVRTSFGFPPLAKANFRYDEVIGGGALLDAAGYTVRSAHLFGGDDLQVKGAHLYRDPERGTSLWGAALLDNADGVSAQVAFGFDHFYQCTCELWGSTGRIVMPHAFTPKPTQSPTVILERQGERHEYQIQPDDHFGGSLREFYRAITEEDQQSHYEAVLRQSRTLEDIRRLSAS